MDSIDRRTWLRTAGFSSGLAILGGWNISSASTGQLELPNNAEKIAKLNFNENPFGPSKIVRSAITNAFNSACRYPYREIFDLVERIARKEGVSTKHIVLTGGSTEGLKAAGLTYSLGGGEIIAADPTFQALMTYAEHFGAYVHRVPVNKALEHDLEAMAARLNSRTRMVYLCNPNNPTGTIIEKSKLLDFCTSVENKALVFSDEAYYDFITEPDYPSMVELVKKDMNLIVSKTFSKVYGMAGMRIGYLVARPDIASRLKKSIMAMTNMLAIYAAKAALEDDTFYKFSIAKNWEAKQLIYQTLNSLKLPYVPSHTNFVFFESGRPISVLQKQMLNENVAIGRPFPPFTNWARISTGKIDDVMLFDKALKKVLG